MAQAINRAVNKNADVINCSWGISEVSAINSSLAAPLLESAIYNALRNGRNGKGCVVVFSSGNIITGVDESPDILYPAYINDSILVVGAIDSNMVKASFSKYGSKLDVVAPGVSILSTHNNNGYATWDGTSMAAPHVSGIAGLILSVNPNLTEQQVRDIIESTAQKVGNYNYRPSAAHHNGDWWVEVGYGLVDAYAAVQKAMNYRNDLYIRDTVTDDGTMPSSCYSTWDSPDIEVVDTLGHKVANLHGNTKYAVRVRIHNRRDVASSGTERLFLNWAKAGFNDSWDEYWTGNNPLPCGAPKGGVIGSANGKIIPSIPANSYRIDTIHWITPAGEDYEYCTDFNYNQWHFCLLARIHDDDVIAHENEHDADVHQLVKNHNNVAQQNVYLDSAENYRKTLGIGNVHTIDMSRIICLSPKVIGNVGSITDFAEVYITLDAGLLAAINSANISGLTWVNSNTLRWNGGSASIPVTLPANSYYTLQTTVHFLADQIPASNNFDFDMVLRNAAGDTVLGGEHYQCIRTNGRWFEATFTCNTNVLLGDPVTLVADDINEDADYQWYDEQGNSIGNGLTCIVNPQQTTSYTLRVTADADGYRAYRTVSVLVTDGELRQLSPNPADNQVRIGYALSRNVSAATLQILNGSGQMVYSQALSGGNNSKVTGEAVVNTSSLAAGSYTVRLVSSNGRVHDRKTLVVR
ncbi:MAG: S8 family peptidase [Bacteroidales bacterium]|nr:S8 family peptidase [Bacteroidales bacterium]